MRRRDASASVLHACEASSGELPRLTRTHSARIAVRPMLSSQGSARVRAVEPSTREADALVEMLCIHAAHAFGGQMQQRKCHAPAEVIDLVFLPKIDDCIDAVRGGEQGSAPRREAAADRQLIVDPDRSSGSRDLVHDLPLRRSLPTTPAAQAGHREGARPARLDAADTTGTGGPAHLRLLRRAALRRHVTRAACPRLAGAVSGHRCLVERNRSVARQMKQAQVDNPGGVHPVRDGASAYERCEGAFLPFGDV